MQSAKTENERIQVWTQFSNRLVQRSFEANLDFSRRLGTDSILLRDELLSRLPKASKDDKVYEFYEHPTNVLGMTALANDLERLAKSLP